MNLKNAYKKLLGERFFNKVVATYTVITVCVMLILTFVIIQSVKMSAKNQAIEYSKQVVSDVTNYFKEKSVNVKHIQELPYLLNNPFYDVIDFLNSGSDPYSPDYATKRMTTDNFLKYGSLIDNSVYDVILIKTKDKSAYFVTNRGIEVSKFTDFTYLAEDEALLKSNSYYGLKEVQLFLPPSLRSSLSDDFFCIGTNIKDMNIPKTVGILLVTFSKQGIKNAYYKENARFESRLVVMSQTGRVIFDSAGKWDGSHYPGFSKIKGQKKGMYINNEGITHLDTTEELGLFSVLTVSNSQLYKNVHTFIRTIIFITLLCILVAILLSYASMSLFYKKIKKICFAMAKVKTGDLSGRIRLKGSRDEIGMIAESFNMMCDHLNDYINKVYISGIKQKEAELSALQSQINPHFLYNTLEAIRMKALSTGDEDVGNMIRLLGSLFRNSIRYETIVKISNEIDCCKYYLELLSLRYGEDMDFNFDIDPSSLGYGIVKHTLQPLIENVMVHGIDTTKPKIVITIQVTMVGSDIQFVINDNGIGIQQEELKEIKKRLKSDTSTNNGSIGLVNVNQRIRLIYGSPYGLMIDSIYGIGTVITVRIPGKKVEELKKSVQGSFS